MIHVRYLFSIAALETEICLRRRGAFDLMPLRRATPSRVGAPNARHPTNLLGETVFPQGLALGERKADVGDGLVI